MTTSLVVRLPSGQETEVEGQSFAHVAESNRIQLDDGAAFEKLRQFAGPQQFTLVTDLGEEFQGCAFTDHRGWMTYASTQRTTFFEQLMEVNKLQESYAALGGTLALRSQTQFVEGADLDIAGEGILQGIEKLKSVAATSGQKRKAEEFDRFYGNPIRRDRESSSKSVIRKMTAN